MTNESQNLGSVDKATSLESLTITSFNLAGCVPSMEAPPDWNEQIVTDAIRTELLNTNPDILALQECPDDRRGQWTMKNFESKGYHALGSVRSHAGYVMVLVRKEITDARLVLPDDENNGGDLPAVVIELTGTTTASSDSQPGADVTTKSNRKVLIASVHLAPFGSNSLRRKKQMKELLQVRARYVKEQNNGIEVPLLVVGDTNMRPFEDEIMEDELEFQDLWKVSGSDETKKYTWDTKDHTGGFIIGSVLDVIDSMMVGRDGDTTTTNTTAETPTYSRSFNRYYGSDTRQYVARYDRMYITKQEDIMIPNVQRFDLIANKPVTNKYHFLSDHFGLTATLDLDWKEEDIVQK